MSNKKKCSFCEATAKGSIDRLINLGWAWAVIYAKGRKTTVACPKHHKELNEEINRAIGAGKGVSATKKSEAKGE